MLQRPDVGTERLLELADFIEGLESDRFNMRDWGRWEEPRCICGWYGQLHCRFDKMDWKGVANELGISHEVANSLFHNEQSGPKGAARTLRHLAVTGELP